MNKVFIIGRLTKDPEVRYSQGETSIAIARYTLAVNRKSNDANQAADFISCVALGRSGEFAERYLKKGMKIAITGRLQTGSYEKNGVKHYTTDVVVDEHEFCESKQTEDSNYKPIAEVNNDGFMVIPDGIDEELPFN